MSTELAELDRRIASLTKRIKNRQDLWDVRYESLVETNPSWKRTEKDLQFYQSLRQIINKLEAHVN